MRTNLYADKSAAYAYFKFIVTNFDPFTWVIDFESFSTCSFDSESYMPNYC